MSRKKIKDDGIDPNAWLATYSDTITLLMTFFVLLYSFSTIDANKFKLISSALQSVFSKQSGKSILQLNANNGELPMVGIPIQTTNIPGGNESDQMKENMEMFIEQNNLEDVVEIKVDSRGYIFELKEKILFESGQAYLKEQSKPVLDAITKFISGVDNEIIIEGHTDNVPIRNSKYKDNWDLSAARANTVARYFINTKGQDPTRFRPMGLGQYHPKVKNDTPEHRAQNRRVNILIVKESGMEEGDKNE